MTLALMPVGHMVLDPIYVTLLIIVVILQCVTLVIILGILQYATLIIICHSPL